MSKRIRQSFTKRNLWPRINFLSYKIWRSLIDDGGIDFSQSILNGLPLLQYRTSNSVATFHLFSRAVSVDDDAKRILIRQQKREVGEFTVSVLQNVAQPIGLGEWNALLLENARGFGKRQIGGIARSAFPGARITALDDFYNFIECSGNCLPAESNKNSAFRQDFPAESVRTLAARSHQNRSHDFTVPNLPSNLYQLRDGWFNTVSSEASHISLNLIIVTSNNLTIIGNTDVQNAAKIIREGNHCFFGSFAPRLLILELLPFRFGKSHFSANLIRKD